MKKSETSKTKSEFEAHYYLQRSCAAGLEDGGEAAAGATGAEHQVEHRRGLAEQGAGEEADGVGEIRVVEGVEGLDAELQRALLTEREFAARGQVQLGHAETAEGVASQIALLPTALGGKGQRLKCITIDAAATGRRRIG